MKKKLLTAMLMLVLLLCVLPMAAAAEGEEGGSSPAPVSDPAPEPEPIVTDICTELGYHNWSLSSSTPATCSTPGTKYYVCLRNSSHTMTETVEPFGHNIGKDESRSTKPDCVNAAIETYKCIRPGCTYEYQVKVSELGHNWKKDESESVPPTCTDAGTEVYYCERNHEHKKQ